MIPVGAGHFRPAGILSKYLRGDMLQASQILRYKYLSPACQLALLRSFGRESAEFTDGYMTGAVSFEKMNLPNNLRKKIKKRFTAPAWMILFSMQWNVADTILIKVYFNFLWK